MRTRIVVVPILLDAEGRILLCRRAADPVVSPGQWELPGEPVGPGERSDAALRREVRENLGVHLVDTEPLLFRDDVGGRRRADGSRRALHLILLVYRCSPVANDIAPNGKYSQVVWAAPSELEGLDLEDVTRAALTSAGYVGQAADAAQIRSAIDGFIDAYNSGDIDSLLTLYSEDLVKMRHRAAPESKRETASRLQAFFAGNTARLTVQTDELIVSGHSGFTRGTLVIEVNPRSNGAPQTIRRRFIELWRKESGRWKVARTMDAEP